MSSRLRRVNSWDETHKNVVRARKFAENYGIADAHPDDYILPNTDAEWERLLNKIK